MKMTQKIMLIDDDSDDQELFCEAILDIDSSIEAVTAVSATEAFEKLVDDRVLPAVIFLDINMPVISGWECLKRIKQNPQLSSIPVIMYSTSPHDREKETAQRLGAWGLVTKPSDFETLKLTFKEIIEHLARATPLRSMEVLN
jgi:CheY-like chemotaxis protein